MQIKLYGLISCVVATLFVLAGLLFFTVWLFSLVGKTDSSDGNDYTLEHDFSSDVETSSKKDSDNTQEDKEHVGEEVYTSKWDLPITIKEKAMFWRATPSRDSVNDYGYDSLIDIYANETTEVSRIYGSFGADFKSIGEVDDHGNMSIGDIHFKKVRSDDYYYDDDRLSELTDGTDEYTTARIASKTDNSLQTFSPAILHTASIAGSRSFSSTADLVSFQNISLIADEDEEEEDEENENNGYDDKIIDGYNSSSGQRISRSDGNMFSRTASLKNKESEISDSKIHSINMSKIGPTYLYVYLNMIYGNWDEFEYRSVLSGNDAVSDKLNEKTIKKILKLLNKRVIDDYRKGRILEKLEILRFAFITETYHELILKSVMKNVKFLGEVIRDEKVAEKVKCEIFQLFHCSFWYESKTLLTFEFAKQLIKSSIDSLSRMDVESVGFKDGIRCLHRILVYSNIDDFIGEVFDGCFREVNNLNFEKQNVVWELLKLVICEWMLEADRIEEIEEIYNKLKDNIDVLMDEYVEKDNSKYQEFILIWKMLMLKESSKKGALDLDGSGSAVTDENYNLNYRIKKRYNSVSKIKRKLSVTKNRESRSSRGEGSIARHELRDVTNVTKASD
ncbi:hypothetical protein PMKS-000050 [Pichia membranifaciens]|uniref:Uncharacterized protein n=1 Tax=Pichia membranifaciens TaxID=4926 RepID=A0A1Q2YAM2_9ASCO|nr:hypothetical protein PMKS-000050 [Pichia membranifaciens]